MSEETLVLAAELIAKVSEKCVIFCFNIIYIKFKYPRKGKIS